MTKTEKDGLMEEAAIKLDGVSDLMWAVGLAAESNFKFENGAYLLSDITRKLAQELRAAQKEE